jgi:tetratricopeptide (TPR) repeat protein
MTQHGNGRKRSLLEMMNATVYMPLRRNERLHPLLFYILLLLTFENTTGFVHTKSSSLDKTPSQRRNSPTWKSNRRRISFTALAVDSLTSANTGSNLPNKNNKNKNDKPPQYNARNNQSKNSIKFNIRQLFQQARDLERRGEWRKATGLLQDILKLDPADAHSHLALARLQARRAPQEPQRAVQAFENGIQACPNSIHLWHAYAHYRQSQNQVTQAMELYERALQIDPYNPYVCHAYGLLLMEQHEQQSRNVSQSDNASSLSSVVLTGSNANTNCTIPMASMELWNRALTKTSTAALVCSLGEVLIAYCQDYDAARKLYATHAPKVSNERERTEIYLASSWLEERYFRNEERAQELLQQAVTASPTSSLAKVALARFEGRKRQQQSGGGAKADEYKQATLQKLASACVGPKGNDSVQPEDGRVFNAWANIEVKQRRYSAARTILRKGLEQYPKDHSLLQAAGKMEERMKNYTGARELYAASLRIEPSAPTIVAYALLEIKHSESSDRNLTKAIGLFEEALLVDPRHGPAYNAYARTVFQKLGDASKAREIFQRGVVANCPDAASIYHGYAMLELWLGNVSQARTLLLKGREEVKRQETGKDYVHRERAVFIAHTLGMLELNRNLPADALEVFQDGISRYGNSSQLLLGAALSEVMLGRQDKARSLFEMSVLNDAQHAQAWQAWGVMEMRAGNMETAKTLFESGIKNAPWHGALWQAYATMESRLGNIEGARALFDTGIKKAPNHIPLYQSWAFMEFREGNFLQAKALISKALTRDKRNGSGWLIYSKIEDQMGNDGLASLLLRRGIECAPDMPELYCALGDLMIRRGKINDARQVFEKGLEVDPMHAPLYHSLAELEAKVFNLDGLAALNKRAKKMFNSDALVPAPASTEIFGTKIRTRRARTVPKGVEALAERIVEDEQGSDATIEVTNGLLGKMGSAILEEDGRVSQLLSFGDED